MWFSSNVRARWIDRSCIVVPRQNSDLPQNQSSRHYAQFVLLTCKTGLMLRLLRLFVDLFTRLSRSRRDLLLENRKRGFLAALPEAL
jgi:hypothetical protein